MVGARQKDVVFFEAFAEEQKLLKKFCPKHIRADFISATIQESSLKEPPATFISIRTQSRIPAAWAQDLDGILTRSTGYEHVLTYKERTRSSLALGYLPSYCARAVAEQAFLMIFSLLRKAKEQQKNFLSFDRDGLTGSECQGKKILIVGVGRIGKEVARIARGLGMKVLGVDIVRRHPSLDYVPLGRGLAWADVVVCACALTDKTFGMLDHETLRRAKKGTVLINVARGEISPLKDLKRLLDEKILGGLGLDVYENEEAVAQDLRSRRRASPKTKIVLDLSKKDNVMFTPHNAFNTREALERKARQSFDSVISFLTRKKFPFPVPEEKHVK